jgi:hypothetical protein
MIFKIFTYKLFIKRELFFIIYNIMYIDIIINILFTFK